MPFELLAQASSPMNQDERLRLSTAREGRSREIAYGILCLGLITAGLFAVWALFAKNKTRIFGRIFSFVIIPSLTILLLSWMLASFKKRFDGLQRGGGE